MLLKKLLFQKTYLKTYLIKFIVKGISNTSKIFSKNFQFLIQLFGNYKL